MKPNINSVAVHPQLSNNGHLVDGAPVGAGSLWPMRPSTHWGTIHWEPLWFGCGWTCKPSYFLLPIPMYLGNYLCKVCKYHRYSKSVFFCWQFIFLREKYDFYLFRRTFHGKNGPNSPDFERNIVSSCHIFVTSSSRLPRIYKDFYFYFLLSYLVQSKTWIPLWMTVTLVTSQNPY